MKNRKWFKILFNSLSITVLSSSVAFTMISCGKTRQVYSWKDFLVDAEKVDAIDIIRVTNPTGWEKVSSREVLLGIFQADQKQAKLNVSITRTVDKDDKEIANFEVDYIKGSKYNLKNWKCIQKPQPVSGSWSIFKSEALKVTASDLLAQAKKANNWQDLKWNYGTAAQIKWNNNEQAEFDTFGYLKKSDSFPGMSGNATVSDYEKTITAIISKKGHEGLYDSDPIKATIKFYALGNIYRLSNWKFTTTTQLQSIEKFTSIFEKNYIEANPDNSGSLEKFQENNWMTASGGIDSLNKKATAHDKDANITKLITANGYINLPTTINFLGNETISPQSHIFTSDKKGYQVLLKTENFKYQKALLAQVTLKLNYIFANGKDTRGGGTAYNYTWNGNIERTK